MAILLNLVKVSLDDKGERAYSMVEVALRKGAATLYDSLVRSLPIALYMGQS